MDSIFTRRSVRQFTDEKISDDSIDKLVRAGMQAPTAGNQQAWYFIVVSGQENLENLSKVSPYAGMLKGASHAIICLAINSGTVYPQYFEQDLAACTQNILLEATTLGLGSVWLGVCPEIDRMEFVNDLYNLGKEYIPISIVALGHPLKEEANHFVDRYKEDRVRFVK